MGGAGRETNFLTAGSSPSAKGPDKPLEQSQELEPVDHRPPCALFKPQDQCYDVGLTLIV